jgi:hypothetical protein
MSWDLKFLDTFQVCAPADSFNLGKWTTSDVGFGNTTSPEDGLVAADGGSNCRRAVSGMNSGAIVGTRCRFNNPGAGYMGLLMIDCGANQMRLDYNATTGGFRFFLPLGGNVDTTADGTVSNGTIADAEMAVWFDGADVHWEVKIDGNVMPTLSGTASTGTTPTISYVGCGAAGSVLGSNMRAHFWAKGYSGSGGLWSGTDYYGFCARGKKKVSADGQYAAGAGGARWAPASEPTYFEELDEDQGDSDTSKIVNTTDPGGSPAAADRAALEYEDLPAGVITLKAAQRTILGRKTSGTSATIRLGYSERGSTGDANVVMNAGTLALPSAWGYLIDPLPVDPRDAGVLDVAALETIDGIIQMEALVA